MKKKLVVLLAVVMMFAFSASAYAVDFTDISEQPVTVQDAVAKTTALGIIEGYSDGTFGPEQNITRAEFAKIAVTAAGAKDTAAMLEKNASSFKDVKAGQWYTGWINASESLGIFQGDGNGNFRPNDSISNQEVITVLMRLLGYNDNLTGTWPVNYVTQANKVGILDDVTVVASAAAKRADVVVMLDDTLDTKMVTYDKDTNEFVDKQTTIQGEATNITLLADSFKGTYYEYDEFDAVDQVRDAAKEQLNWTIGTLAAGQGTPAYGSTLIIDKDTKVSYNGGDLFDLEGHQGNVYFVKDGDKYYARFIEVESYTKLVSDQPTEDGSKIKVGSTSYNATKDVALSDNVKNGSKNSKYVLYFNDDDQVYMAKSDKDFSEKAYYVKSVSTNSVKLVAGVKTTTVSMKDGDTLIWNGEEFIAPSELDAGDAVMEITKNDLYVLVDEATGELSKVNATKATIGGNSYVYTADAYLDDEFEDAGITDDEVLGNNVKFILNKDNSIAAILVDDTSTGTKLYGIIIDIGGNTSSLANKTDTLTIFTAEGKNVTYDLDLTTSEIDDLKKAGKGMAKLVEYELNKDGELDEITVIDGTGSDQGALIASEGDEVEVKNNAYLVGNGNTVTLASTAVIFEVGVDDGDIDPTVVTRSSVLGGGDFAPTKLDDVTGAGGVSGTGADVAAYCVYVTNSNGAAKALAYTDADTSKYHYGVIDSYNFKNSDDNNNISFVDGDTYELNNPGFSAKDDDLAVYTMSGSKVNMEFAYGNDSDMRGKTMEVKGYTEGLMTFDTEMTVDVAKNTTDHANKKYDTIMTDNDTVVYVIDASSGDYVLGELSDIAKGAYVFVPVVDKDDYADIVIVDEYTDYDADYTVRLQFTAADFVVEPELDETTAKYGDKVTLTIAEENFTDEEGGTVTIKVDGEEIEAPDSGDYTEEFTVTGNTTVKVERTVE